MGECLSFELIGESNLANLAFQEGVSEADVAKHIFRDVSSIFILSCTASDL